MTTPLQTRIAEVLVWRRVVGFEDFYEVSNKGDVRSIARIGPGGRIMASKPIKPGLSSYGYWQIGLRGKTTRVHVVVAEAFHGPRPRGAVCRHLNGDKLDNRAENLAWGSHADNEADKRAHGRDPSGGRNPKAKINDETARLILCYALGGERNKEISARLNVPYPTVRSITSRQKWSHILAGITPLRFDRVLPPTNQKTFNGAKTHCKRGHPLSGANLRTYTTALGKPARACRACQSMHRRKCLSEVTTDDQQN